MKKRGLGRKLLELSMISLSGSQRNFRCRTALSLRISPSGTPGGIMSEQHDKELLRRAVALAEEAVAGGGRPFGAVICDGEGQIVSEARSVAPHDPRVWTAHSEMQALRAASAAMTWESLGRATIYASGEPCPMCAAAIYWCNIRRLVFSVGEPAMRALREPYERAAGIAMRCDEIFARCGRQVEVVGPLIEHEGLPIHRLFWPNARADV